MYHLPCPAAVGPVLQHNHIQCVLILSLVSVSKLSVIPCDHYRDQIKLVQFENPSRALRSSLWPRQTGVHDAIPELCKTGWKAGGWPLTERPSCIIHFYQDETVSSNSSNWLKPVAHELRLFKFILNQKCVLVTACRNKAHFWQVRKLFYLT